MSSSRVVKMEDFQIPFKEIERATQNFSSITVIGKGGFSWVYKGQLSESWKNQTVAIKRLGHKDKQGNFVFGGIKEDFNRECDFIFKFNHRNIIRFIGYCVEGVEMFMVYEYANYGSLDDHLEKPEKRLCLTWVQRLKICLGAARGLEYIHSGKKHEVVIHRDVKSGNILLGDNFEAKVCDFGFARSGRDSQAQLEQFTNAENQAQLELFTNAAGTPAYMDPVYQATGILRKESDVYSFGVVLFEMLSGSLVNPPRNRDGSTPPNLINQVRRYYDVGLDELTDKYIRDQIDIQYLDPHISDHITISSFYTFRELAYQCISLAPEKRPTMDTIVKTLEKALDIYGKNPALTKIVMKDMELSPRKPVAALTIYEHLVDHEYFEASVFYQLTQIIDVAIQKKEYSYDSMAYWSSNVLALLFLTQQDNEFDDASSLRLTSYVEKLYGIIRDNLKKDLDSLLTKSFKDSKKRYILSPSQPKYIEDIVRCLNTLLSALEDNFVPPIISERIIIQLISYINVYLFNSVLKYPECCIEWNAKDLRDALVEIKTWCSQYATSAIEKLMYLEEIVGLLIKICDLPRSRPPITDKDYVCRTSLSLQQLDRIQTNCQKYPETQLAAKHVISGIIRVMRRQSKNVENNSFLLEDNSSEPISINDLLIEIRSSRGSSAAILNDFPAFPFLYI